MQTASYLAGDNDIKTLKNDLDQSVVWFWSLTYMILFGVTFIWPILFTMALLVIIYKHNVLNTFVMAAHLPGTHANAITTGKPLFQISTATPPCDIGFTMHFDIFWCSLLTLTFKRYFPLSVGTDHLQYMLCCKK